MKKSSLLVVGLLVISCISFSGCNEQEPTYKNMEHVGIIGNVNYKIDSGIDQLTVLFSDGTVLSFYRAETYSLFEYYTVIQYFVGANIGIYYKEGKVYPSTITGINLSSLEE